MPSNLASWHFCTIVNPNRFGLKLKPLVYLACLCLMFSGKDLSLTSSLELNSPAASHAVIPQPSEFLALHGVTSNHGS